MASLPSVHAWRSYAAAAFGEDATDVEAVWASLTELARDGTEVYTKDGEYAGRRKDVAAIKLWLSYRVGPPSRNRLGMGRVESIDPAQLETLEGCRAASQAVLAAQLAGDIDADDAGALRATIDQAIRTHVAAGDGDNVPEPRPITVNLEVYNKDGSSDE